MHFMEAFHRGDAQLERTNRSHMVLIPKKPGAVDVDAFRPICLQNCTLKILTKVLRPSPMHDHTETQTQNRSRMVLYQPSIEYLYAKSIFGYSRGIAPKYEYPFSWRLIYRKGSLLGPVAGEDQK